jgi:hypothetical protein
VLEVDPESIELAGQVRSVARYLASGPVASVMKGGLAALDS